MTQSTYLFDFLSREASALLPVALIGLAVLSIIYRDRLVFTPGKRDGVYEPPKKLPLIGHTIEMALKGTHKQLERQRDYHWDSPTGTWRITIMTVGSVLMVNRPEYIEYIQKTNFENFPKGAFFRNRLGELLGHDGIFVADGSVWKTQRKSASAMFSAKSFQNWIGSVVHSELDTISELLNAVSQQKTAAITPMRSTAGKHAKGSGGIISMTELFFRYTLSSFAKMAFAADLECLTSSPDSLHKPVPFAIAFDYAQQAVNERFLTPAYPLIELLNGTRSKLKHSVKVIDEFGKTIIEQRLAELGESKIGKEQLEKRAQASGVKRSELKSDDKDLLAIFMEHTHDPDTLLTVVLNFIIAGRDTTAQTLSWLFFELCAHPEHVPAIREEVDRVLGKDAADEKRWLKSDDVKKLPYTLACMHEAARLHPAVPKNVKTVANDDVIIPQGPNAENLPPIPVYKGEMIGWTDWAMNRTKSIWGEDAEEFNPHRFLQRDEKGELAYVQYGQWKFHVFNAGPRLCLGMNLANFEALAFTAAALQKYDFTWATDEQGQPGQWPPTYANSLTHPMDRAYTCVVTPRSS